MTPARRLIGALVSCGVLLACASEGGGRIDATNCTLPSEIDRPAEVPADLPWPSGLAVTKAVVGRRFTTVEGFGETTVSDLFERTRSEVTQRNFDVINVDFEGFEAEVYFARAASIAGIARIREGPCDGYVTYSVLYDPLETEQGKKAVEKTRKLTGGG